MVSLGNNLFIHLHKNSFDSVLSQMLVAALSSAEASYSHILTPCLRKSVRRLGRLRGENTHRYSRPRFFFPCCLPIGASTEERVVAAFPDLKVTGIVVYENGNCLKMTNRVVSFLRNCGAVSVVK